ncbi:AAA family ATPase [Streptomyces candidus]|uniref:Energy-coupling factor transporter ATP-binding protein EcfA2 n=1 Tax=Streptomyces candidus TaxID=67283 RepID=A0A7X0HDK9_9ACTN|nr:ATP-binding protein [Streptomyces candidus]MBB6434332.1 energy-coupling factor transporter ATP-binding protein EcfA2 [Streptomyces candidus]GHH37052.1 biotin transporter BioY [Streptomyces candidus]
MTATSTARPAAPVRPHRPAATELRLSAFGPHRGAAFPLGPLTFFAGPSGSGKSTVLRAYEALARLASGEELAEVFADPAACVPEGAVADGQGRRGFRIGCTVDGPLGPVHLDLAVQAEPDLRIVSERLTYEGQELLTTTLRDPRQPKVQAAWYTAGAVPVTRAPLPDDRLATALLPLRVAGRTEGELLVLAAAEQVLVALRSVFVCDPQPQRMRAPAAAREVLLRRGCDNLAAVLRRTGGECANRHHALVKALGAGCAGPVTDLTAEDLPDGSVRALIGRGTRGVTPVGRLGEGELRYLALALVLLTGPRVVDVEQEVGMPDAHRALTVLADGFDRAMDARQVRALTELAGEVCRRGHLRLTGTVADASPVRGGSGVTVVDLVP